MAHAESRTFNDYWHRQFTAGKSGELYYASGTSTIKSTGTFNLSCIENVVSIGGKVDHHWYDPYDWHAGLSAFIPGFGDVSDEEALEKGMEEKSKEFVEAGAEVYVKA